MGNLSFTSSPYISDLPTSDEGETDSSSPQGPAAKSMATVKIAHTASQLAPFLPWEATPSLGTLGAAGRTEKEIPF